MAYVIVQVWKGLASEYTPIVCVKRKTALAELSDILSGLGHPAATDTETLEEYVQNWWDMEDEYSDKGWPDGTPWEDHEVHFFEIPILQ